jgi:hypothetical protein
MTRVSGHLVCIHACVRGGVGGRKGSGVVQDSGFTASISPEGWGLGHACLPKIKN